MEEISRSQDASGLFRGLSWLFFLLAVALFVGFATAGFNSGSGYYWGMTSAALPIAGFVLLRRAARGFVIRSKVRRRWGLPPNDDIPVGGKAMRSYFHSLSLPAGRTVDDRTWEDLAMDEIRTQIDVCYSSAGSNELYVLLRRCLPSEQEAGVRRRLVARLRKDESFRMSLLSEIALLDNDADHDPASILTEKALVEDRLFPLYLVLSIGAAALLFSPILVGLRLGIFAILGIFVLNMWVYHRKSRQVSSLVPPLRGLFRILRQGGRIARLDFKDTGFDRDDLRAQVAKTAGLSRSFRSILTGSAAGSASAGADIVETLTIYVKIIFLVDLIAYSRLAKGIRKLLDPLRKIYRAVGYLDAVHSVASYLEWADLMSSPRIVDLLMLRAEEVYHPLLEEPVANSITLEKPGAIVTGTNMAGKSTFLRCLGVNAILAQTIGACFATSYTGSAFLVMSSIEKTDVLEEGKSFYYAEAERIFRMIENLEEGTPVLLLIDELLSGTNSLERESASRAILEYLSQRNALTVAATHDVAIAQGLEDRYAVYYFTDRATESGLSFDYLIRPGIVKTRNAIKLLSLIGYPQEVIDSALRRAGEEKESQGS